MSALSNDRANRSLVPAALWAMAAAVTALMFALLIPPAAPAAGSASESAAQSGAAWLRLQQDANGGWSFGSPGLSVRNTAAAVAALAATGDAGAEIVAGSGRLAGTAARSTDALARAVTALVATGGVDAARVQALAVRQTADGSWGATANVLQGNPFDSALALIALDAAAASGADVAAGLAYLVAEQGGDGSWSLAPGMGSVQATATALQALAAYQDEYDVAAPMATAIAYLHAAQNGDGSIGSSVTDTALAHRALWAALAPDAAVTTAARLYLRTNQDGDGSWGGDIYASALAVHALAETERSQIGGRVVDGLQQSPLAGAALTLSASGGVSATSSADGSFLLKNVPPGAHDLTLSANGYTSRTIPSIVAVGEAADVGTITLAASGPVVDFDWSPKPVLEGTSTFGCQPHLNCVTFSSTSVAQPGTALTEYIWSASNGESQRSTSQSSWSTYFIDNGSYTVTLAVRDSLGRINIAQKPVEVENVAPTVDAGADITAVVNALVAFDGAYNEVGSVDKAVIDNIQWQFGDGNGSSRILDTAWRYTTVGTYSATLQVSDQDGGIGSAGRTITVLANNAPVAAFSVDPAAPISEGRPMRFSDASSDPDAAGPELWHWDFGDGATTGLKSPPHYYADDGVFTVTMTISDSGGLSATTTQLYTVTNVAPLLALTGPLTVPLNTAIDFVARAGDESPVDDASLGVSWDFGDGTLTTTREITHAWTATGAYTLTLQATDKDGATTTLSNTVTVIDNGPVAVITNSGGREAPHGAGTTFRSDSSIGTIVSRQWFWDGAQVSTATNFSVGQTSGLNTLGLHIVRLLVTDDGGRTAATEQIFRFTPRLPRNWSPFPRTTPAGLPVSVPYLSGGHAQFTSKVEWGDGTSDDDFFNQTHIYPIPGVYSVTIHASSDDGNYLDTILSSVEVLSPSLPVVDFLINTIQNSLCPELDVREGDNCLYDSVRFSNPPRPTYTTDASQFVRQTWFWGDGSAPTIKNSNINSDQRHIFADSGFYTVTMRMLTSSGLTNTVSHLVTVTNIAPTADAGVDRTVLLEQEITIEGRGADASAADLSGMTFEWEFGNETTAPADYVDGPAGYVRYAWDTPGTYSVTLTVTDPDGDSGADVALYTVRNNRPPFVRSSAPGLAVAGSLYSYLIDAGDADGDLLTFTLIQGPQGMTISPAGLLTWTPAFEQAGFHLVKLIVSDPFGDGAIHQFGVSVADQPFTPDLVPISVAATVTSDPQSLSMSGVATTTIKNFGIVDVTTPFTLTLFDDGNRDQLYSEGVDTHLGSVQIAGLSGDSAVTVVKSVSGTVSFRDNLIHAYVDSSNTVAEGAREDNNIRHSGETQRFAAAVGLFAPRLETAWSGSPVHHGPWNNGGDWGWVLTTPVVAPLVDSNGDGAIDQNDVPAIVFLSFAEAEPGVSTSRNVMLRAIRADDGSVLFDNADPNSSVRPGTSGGSSGPVSSELAIGDLDGDGRPEIVNPVGSGRTQQLRVYANDGTVKFTTNAVNNNFSSRGAPALADLDGDGTLEMIYGNAVWNADGSQRWVGGAANGRTGSWSGASCCYSIVADLDLDGSPEVVVGNAAYRADGAIYWDRAAAPDNAPDGMPAVANFDADLFPEIVVVSQVAQSGTSPAANGELRLYEHDGTLIWGPVLTVGALGRRGGGPPVVADFSGDGIPDIGVAGYEAYAVYDGRDGAVLWQRPTQDFSSWQTGSSAFDFDGDGRPEIVYNDELYLYVFDGGTGAVLWQTPNSSSTWVEYPTIVDADGDGHAEIIAVRNQFGFPGEAVGQDDGGIYIYGDRFNSWRPARVVWNQHSYHITNVDDDGRIATAPQPNWLKYNNFRTQVAPDSVDPFAAPDLTASRLWLDASACPAELSIIIRVGNGGSTAVAAGVTVALYVDGAPVSTAATPRPLAPGDFVDVSLLVSGPAAGSHLVTAIVDDAALAAQLHAETREDNNDHQRTLSLCDAGNVAPQITSIAPTTATVGQLLRYAVVASDGDGDPLLYDLPEAPAGSAIDSAQGFISWRAQSEQRGVNSFTLRVVDGQGGSALQSFNVDVGLPLLPQVPLLCTIAGGVPGAAEVANNGIDDDCNPETADSVATGTVSATVASERPTYSAHQSARLIATVFNSSSSTYQDLDVTLTVRDAARADIYTAQFRIAQLAPDSRIQLADTFDTADNAPGSYDIAVSVRHGAGVVAQAAAEIEIVAADAVATALLGTIAPLPASPLYGELFTVTWSVTNGGNGDLTDALLRLLIIDPDSGVPRSTYSETVSVALGTSLTRTLAYDTLAYGIGPLIVVLDGQVNGVTQTIAVSGVDVMATVPTAVALRTAAFGMRSAIAAAAAVMLLILLTARWRARRLLSQQHR